MIELAIAPVSFSPPPTRAITPMLRSLWSSSSGRAGWRACGHHRRRPVPRARPAPHVPPGSYHVPHRARRWAGRRTRYTP